MMTTSYTTRAGVVREAINYGSALEIILEALEPMKIDGSGDGDDADLAKFDDAVAMMTNFSQQMGEILDDQYEAPSAYDALFQYHANIDVSEMTPKYSWLHALDIALMAVEVNLPDVEDGQSEEEVYDDDAWMIVHASELLRYLAVKHGDAIGVEFAVTTLDTTS